MKQIKKRPTEVFGYDCDTNLNDKAFKLAIKQQYCRYIKSTCVKPRKSEPTIKVGICSLGATVGGDKTLKPVIICPQRFKEDTVFEAVRQKYLSNWKNVKWIPEVNIGVGGSVDYVAVEVGENGDIKDFLCVELQAAGTTGSPYPAVQEIISTGKFKSETYDYGINWANEFSKTMMQQAYKKGKILKSWKRKIVFVVQDVAIDYLKTATDCSLLTRSNKKLPIDFCTFKLTWDNNKTWNLVFDKIYSTSIDGINLMLGGASVSEYLTEEEFIQNIIKKGIADGILNRNNYF